MNLSIIQLTAFFLIFGSAFFISRAYLGLNPNVISNLASTKHGYNKTIMKSLAEQNADNLSGILLLLFSLLLQVGYMLSVPTESIALSVKSVSISFIISLFLFFGLHKYSRWRSNSLTNSAEAIWKEKHKG